MEAPDVESLVADFKKYIAEEDDGMTAMRQKRMRESSRSRSSDDIGEVGSALESPALDQKHLRSAACGLVNDVRMISNGNNKSVPFDSAVVELQDLGIDYLEELLLSTEHSNDFLHFSLPPLFEVLQT